MWLTLERLHASPVYTIVQMSLARANALTSIRQIVALCLLTRLVSLAGGQDSILVGASLGGAPAYASATLLEMAVQAARAVSTLDCLTMNPNPLGGGAPFMMMPPAYPPVLQSAQRCRLCSRTIAFDCPGSGSESAEQSR